MGIIALFSFSFGGSVLLSLLLLEEMLPLPAAVCVLGLFALSLIFSLIFGRRFMLVTVLFAGVAAGLMWRYGYERIFVVPALELDGKTLSVDAVALDFSQETDYGGYLDVKLRIEDTAGVKTRLYAYDDALSGVCPGDVISLTADFERADRIDGDRITSFVSRGFFLFGGDVRDVTFVRGARSRLLWMHRYIGRAVRETVDQIFPESTAHVIRALLTGDRSGIEDDAALVSDFTRSGIIHILTVSGMHVSILASAILMVFGRKRSALVLTSMVLLVFMSMCGCTASVVRATVMQLFVLGAMFFRRDNDSPTALAVSMLLVIAANPYAALGVGFQLSFSATLGLVTLSGGLYGFLIEKLVHKKDKRPVKRVKSLICGGISSTLGATAFTLPLQVLYFGRVSLIAPVTNLLVMWFVSPIFALSFVAVGVGLLSLPAGRIAALLPSMLTRVVELEARVCARPFFASVYVDGPALTLWAAGTYLCFLVLLAARVKPVKTVAPVCVAIISLCGILVSRTIWMGSREGFSATVLDVGQGQCVVLSCEGHLAVVDCGSSSGEDADAVAERFIQSQGRDSVDILVLTHFHDDHVNGVEKLLASMYVKTLVVPPDISQDGESAREDILALAEERGTELVYVEEDMTVLLGEMELTLFAPRGSSSENERGVSILAGEDDFEVLITGDIDASLELELLRTGNIPDIECLVVGHHGSKYSTSEKLLEVSSPETAVISVGENDYGHPSEEVLRLLQENGIQIYRTDEDGNVTIRSE